MRVKNKTNQQLHWRLMVGVCFALLTTPVCAEPTPSPMHSGNFALRSSQQPGPLLGFGDNIIDKGQIQLSFTADEIEGVRQHAFDLRPGVIYGVSDVFSLYFSVPYAASYQSDSDSSSGFEDASLQAEYAFYNQTGATFVEQATVVGSIGLPSGSATKLPATGAGSLSLFGGLTYNRIYPEWLFYTSHGINFTTMHAGTKFGNSFLYQGGMGKNVFTLPNHLIVALQTEVDGTYTEKNRMNGQLDPNSGGNIVYVTPSLWVSTPRLRLQFGVGVPVSQHLYGSQLRQSYLWNFSVAWTV